MSALPPPGLPSPSDPPRGTHSDNQSRVEGRSNPLADFVADMAPPIESIPDPEPVTRNYGSSADSYEFDFGEPSPPPPPGGGHSDSFGYQSSGTSEDTESSGISAKMYVETVDLLMSKLCGAIADKDSKIYTLDPDEKKQYIKVTREYFKTVDINVSPTTVFVLTTLALFGPNLIIAIGHRRRMSATKKRFAKSGMKVTDDAGSSGRYAKKRRSKPTVINVDKEPRVTSDNAVFGPDAPEVPVEGIGNIPARTSFSHWETPEGNFYRTDRWGNYAPVGERERVHPEVQRMWDSGMRAKDIKEKFGIS